MDTLSEFLAIDHNRCILCGRCVRACNQVAASYTLDFGGRGGKTCVTADVNQKLNESSCTQCGACLQACPTGAIMSKISMYKGKNGECQAVPTVCPGCGVGCELKVLVKDNNIVRIESPVLSSRARSALPDRPLRHRQPGQDRRITAPLVRNPQGDLEETSLESALSIVGQKMHDLKNDFGGIISPQCSNETLAAFRQFFENIGSDLIDSWTGKPAGWWPQD